MMNEGVSDEESVIECDESEPFIDPTEAVYSSKFHTFKDFLNYGQNKPYSVICPTGVIQKCDPAKKVIV